MFKEQDIAQSWRNLVNKLVFLEKRYVFKHGGLELHPSELHVMMAICAEPQANATKLASMLGVTKGAASQTLKRLETKRMIVKRRDPTQKNEVTSTFTRLGRAALEQFQSQRSAIHKRFENYLASLSESQAKTVCEFLKEAQAMLPENE